MKVLRFILLIGSFWVGSLAWSSQTSSLDSIFLETEKQGALVFRPSEGVVFVISFDLHEAMRRLLRESNQNKELFFGEFDRRGMKDSDLYRSAFRKLDRMEFEEVEGFELEDSITMTIRSKTLVEEIGKAIGSGQTFSIAAKTKNGSTWLVGSFSESLKNQSDYKNFGQESPKYFCSSVKVFGALNQAHLGSPLSVDGLFEQEPVAAMPERFGIDCDTKVEETNAFAVEQWNPFAEKDGNIFVGIQDGLTRDGFKKMMKMREKAIKYCLRCAADKCLVREWPEERRDEFALCKRLFTTPRKPIAGLLDDASIDATTKSFRAAFDFKINKKGRGELVDIRHLDGDMSNQEARKVISRALYRVKYEPLKVDGVLVEITNLSSAVGRRNSVRAL